MGPGRVVDLAIVPRLGELGFFGQALPTLYDSLGGDYVLNGYIDEYPMQKYMRDARVMTLYEGTCQVQKLFVGWAETGVSSFL